MNPEIKIQKYVYTRIQSGFCKAVVNFQIIKVNRKHSTRPNRVPIWHMDPEIKIQKYVYTRILSGFNKAVVELQLFKVKVHLLLGPTRLLPDIWIQKLKNKNMFIPGF